MAEANFSDHRLDLQRDGFTNFSLGKMPSLLALQRGLIDLSSRYATRPLKALDQLHEVLPLSSLNSLRLEAIQAIHRDTEFRADLSNKVAPLLIDLLGPDLAVQKKFNLVISIPGDPGSQIPMHADTWTGNSPFELNLWIPLTEVAGTQSMFILPLQKWKARKREWDRHTGTIQDCMENWRDDFRFIALSPGEVLLFWHALPHGNVVNQEKSTRWALNLRFKNTFTPYGEKSLGDYFTPWK